MAHAQRFPAYLRDIQDEIEGYARDYGLDFFDDRLRGPRLQDDERGRRVRRLPDALPALALRHGLRAALKGYEYGLSKIYEMVINNNPAYAYLLEGNSLVDQKMVMAHVCGHVRLLQEQLLLLARPTAR